MENSFGCGSLATVKNVKKFLTVAMHGHPKNSPNKVNIYINLLEIQWGTRIQNSNDDLTWLKEIIDLGSNVVIFGWPVITDPFFTLDEEKF